MCRGKILQFKNLQIFSSEFLCFLKIEVLSIFRKNLFSLSFFVCMYINHIIKYYYSPLSFSIYLKKNFAPHTCIHKFRSNLLGLGKT